MVTTQELEAGDELRRFKPEAVQDEPRGGNGINQYISSRSECARPVVVNCVNTHVILYIFFLCVFFFASFFFRWFTCV